MSGEGPGLLERVGREIAAEVRRQRALGAFPPTLERRLDRLFAEVVPPAAAEDDSAEALSRVEQAAYVDVEAPTASRLPAARLVKASVRALVGWYLTYLAQQFNRFASASVSALSLLDRRVARLEQESRGRLAVAPPPSLRKGSGDASPWADLVRAALGAPSAPVLHAECAEGGLLRALAEAGIDAYGIDPRAELLDEAALAGLEVRWEEPLGHLRDLPAGSLGGLVLSGCVDRLEVPAQRELAALAARDLAPGAAVVVIGTMPGAWTAARWGVAGDDPGAVVEADLAPGRPLHPQTWVHLLTEAGLGEVDVVEGPRPEGLPRLEGPGPEADSLNAKLERLEQVLCRPASFAVVARRPSVG